MTVPPEDTQALAERIETFIAGRFECPTPRQIGSWCGECAACEAYTALAVLVARLNDAEAEREELAAMENGAAEGLFRRLQAAESALRETREALRRGWTLAENYPLSGKVGPHDQWSEFGRRCCELLEPKLAASLWPSCLDPFRYPASVPAAAPTPTLTSVKTGAVTVTYGKAATCPDCGLALLVGDAAAPTENNG